MFKGVATAVWASIFAIVLASLALPARAANGSDMWTGNSSVNWSDPLNWTGTNTPPLPNDLLIFAGNNNTSNNNDFTANTQFNGITFAAGAGSFMLGGNAIVLGGDIVDNSVNAQTIALPLLLNGGTVNVSVVSGGSLSLGALTFGSAPLSTVTSTLNLNNSVAGSSLVVQTQNSAANTINIASGATYSLSGNGQANNAIVVIGSPPTLSSGTSTSNLTLAGAGTFNVSNTNANFVVGVGSGNNSTSGFAATLDMRNLANFVYDTGASGTGNFYVGVGTRSTGTIHLANTSNVITAVNLTVGDSAQTPGFTNLGTNNNAGGTSNVFLGAGTNVFNLGGTFTIGQTKGVGNVQFETTSGSIVIQGKDPVNNPTQVPNIVVSRESSGSGSGTSQLLLAGHNATISANTVSVGVGAGSSGASTGVLTFDTGTFTANTLNLALHSSGTGAVNGTFTMGGATPNNTSAAVLTVNNAFNLANRTGSGTSSDVGTFVLNGGTVNTTADIVDASTQGTRSTVLTVAGGTLNMNGHAIGSSGAPITTVNLPGNGGQATLSNLGGSGITTSANTAGGLLMDGVGQLNLTGVNNYSGDTTISSSGTLNVLGSITGGGNVNVNAGTLSGTGDGATTGVVGNVSVNGGTVHPGTVAGDVGRLTTAGLTFHSGALAIDLGSGFTADRVVDNGDLTLGDNAGSSLTLALAGATPAAGAYDIIDYTGALTRNADFSITGPLGFNYSLDYSTAGKVFLDVAANGSVLTWNGAADGKTWDTTHANFSNGTSNVPYADPTPVSFNDTAPANATTITIVGTVSPSTVAVNSATNNFTFQGAGAIGGAATLVKDGPSTLTLVNNNTYTGATTINAGTVQVGNGGTTGSLGSGGVAVNAAGTLAYNRSDVVIVPNNISGAGTLKQLGPGTLVLTGNDTYANTVISAGTIQVGNGTDAAGTLGTGPVTDNGTLAFDRPDALTVTNAISGTGGVSSIGPGVLTLSGTNGFTGPVTVAAGSTLKVTNSNSIGATAGTVGAVTVANGGTFDLGGTTTASSLNFGNRTFHIRGAGIDNGGNHGALLNSASAAQLNAFNFIALDGDATIAGSRMDIGRTGANPVLDLQGHTLTTAMTGSQPIFAILGGTTVTSGNIVVTLPSGASNSGLDIERNAVVHDDGVSKITFNAGTSAEFFESSPGSVTRPLVFLGNNFIGGGSGNLATVNSNITLQGNVTLQASTSGVPSATANDPLVLAGNIGESGGSFGLTKVGPNTVTLAGNNAYSGGTTLNAGTLQVNTATGLGAAAGAVTVNAATLLYNGSYTSANPVVLNDGGSVLDVTAGNTAVITGAVSGSGTLNKGTATGTLQIAQPGGFTANGDVNVNGGTLAFGNASGATGPLTVPGTLNVADGATVNLLPTAGIGITHSVIAVNLNSTGRLDLGNHGIVTSTDVNTIRQYAINGYNGGAWNGAGGIGSTYAAAHPNYGVGYGTNSTGQTVAKVALLGDTTLKGSVGFGDYQNLLSNFGTTSGSTWAQGDTNYDGAVGFGDYQTLLSNFGKTSAAGGTQPNGAAPLANIPADVKLSGSGSASTAATASTTTPAVAGVPTVTLTITADLATHTFKVFATDSSGDNAGLATYGIDVVGAGGAAVVTSKARAPRGFNADQGLASGFSTQVSNGAAGIEITASQALAYAGGNDPSQDALVYQHVGQQAGSQDGATWAQPVLIADGTFTGDVGTLTANVHSGDQIQVLAAVANGNWQGPGNVLQAGVVPSTVVLSPEPTSLGLLAVGAGGLLARRRRRRQAVAN